MRELGRVTYLFFDRPERSVRLELEVVAYADHYTARVLFNGVGAKSRRSGSLGAALRWAMGKADLILRLLDLGPLQLRLASVEAVVRQELVA